MKAIFNASLLLPPIDTVSIPRSLVSNTPTRRLTASGIIMRNAFATALVGVALAVATGIVEAKGCITGAAVGGVAGHVAGHHGLVGAAAGCAINHHRNKVKDEKAASASTQPAQTAAEPSPTALQPTSAPRK